MTSIRQQSQYQKSNSELVNYNKHNKNIYKTQKAASSKYEETDKNPLASEIDIKSSKYTSELSSNRNIYPQSERFHSMKKQPINTHNNKKSRQSQYLANSSNQPSSKQRFFNQKVRQQRYPQQVFKQPQNIQNIHKKQSLKSQVNSDNNRNLRLISVNQKALSQRKQLNKKQIVTQISQLKNSHINSEINSPKKDLSNQGIRYSQSRERNNVVDNFTTPNSSTIISNVVNKDENASKDKTQENKSLKKSSIRDQVIEKKNLESFRVQFKKIQQVYEEKRREEQAKNFILKLKKEKRQFEGQLYLIKQQQQQKRKMKIVNQNQQKVVEQQLRKLHRLKQAEKKIQFFKQKEAQRSRKIERNSSLPMKTKLQRINQKLQRFKTIEEIKASPPASNILGNKYLVQSGRMRKRSKTQSNQYPPDLTEEEINELEKIREKIDILTKQLHRT